MNLLSINYKSFLLICLILISILPKWVIGFFLYDLNENINILINFNDSQYFPLILNLANLDFGQSYIDHFSNYDNFAVLLTPLFFHALFFKFGGLIGIIFIDIIYQLILIYLLFKVIQKIFVSSELSFIFCYFIFGSIIVINYFDSYNLNLLIGQIDSIFGSRVPRPIFSSIFLFLFFYLILDLKYQLNNNIKYKYLLILAFSLAMLINSFLYYFLNCFILLFFLYFLVLKKSSLFFLKNNLKKISFFSLSLFLFIIPFIVQYILKEEDHAIRMGLFAINFDQKIFFLKNYTMYFLRPEVIFVIFLSTIFFIISNLKNKYKDVLKLNIFYYFFISSLISPIIFVIFSPKLISIHHFILIAKFGGFFYLLLIFIYICVNEFNLGRFIKILSNNILVTLFLFLLIYLNIENYNHDLISKKKTIQDYKSADLYLEEKGLKNTELKLFSNDSGINNLWLMNNNRKLLLSDGWINSLKDQNIEYLLFNSLKTFGVSTDEFDNFLSFGQRLGRTPLFLFLFNYKYQANSLRTFSEILNYDNDTQKIIKNSSIFRAQEQIVPENEKKRMKEYFFRHSINKNLSPDIVIIYESTFPFNISNTEYIKLKELNNLIIYEKKNF